MRADLEYGVAGFINVKVKHIDGSVTETGRFKNLILDNFLSRFANNDQMINTAILCRVGTGTTPPANTDTSLVSQVGTIARTGGTETVGVIDAPNNRVVAKSFHQFIASIGAITGNISEIGFDFISGSGLCSRSLTKDPFGTPTPITVTATDQLVVEYELQVYVPLVDYTATVPITIDSVTTNYDVIGRVGADYNRTVNEILLASTVTSGWFVAHGSTSVFGAHGVNPTAESGTNSSTRTMFLNISGGKEAVFSASINQLNASGGIKVLTVPIGATFGKGYKYEFTPVIPKTSSLNFNLRLRFTCVRA